MAFTYSLGASVRLVSTEETGTIISRMESDEADNCYLVRYVDAEGVQREAWWNEDALRAPA